MKISTKESSHWKIQQLVYWSLFIIQKLFLPNCLQSLISQTLKNIEIIIVNDGSTDGSQKIIDHYARKDGRIKTIRQENQGLGAVRNKGIEAASGEFLAFIDSDDWIEPDYCQSMYEKAKDEDATLSSVIMPSKFRIPENGLPGHRENYEGKPKEAFIKALLKGQVSGFSWNKLYRRSLIEQHKLVSRCATSWKTSKINTSASDAFYMRIRRRS